MRLTETETELSFPFLLFPRTQADFFADGWQKGPYVIKRGRPDYFSNIFGVQDLDRVISLSAGLSPEYLRLVRTEGTKLNERPVERRSDGTADIFSTYRAYNEGFSIVVNSAASAWLPVATLCRNLEKTLRHRIAANLYATPAGAQGFIPHYDTHDVIVLQLVGCKNWKIYRPVVNMPLDDSKVRIDPEHLVEPYRDLVLEPGDLLYLPRGWVHEASTSDVSSIHLTLGIHVTKWLEVMMDAINMAAAQDEELRSTFPFESLGAGLQPADVAVKLHEMLGRVIARLPAQAAVEGRARQAANFFGPAPDGHFSDLDRLPELDLQTDLRLRDGILPTVMQRPQEVAINFRGNSVRGPEEIAPALRFVATHDSFRVCELPELNDEAKATLAKRLIVEGLLAFN